MAKSKIIKELANNEITMEVALNRLLIIASDLNNDDLAEWAATELHGYSKDMELPAYRKKKSMHFTYSGINGGFQVTNIPFTYYSIISEHDEDAFDVPIMDSITTLQGFLDNSNSQSYCRDFTYLSGAVYKKTGISCTSILQQVPLNLLQNILGEIKTRLLRVLIKLDKEYGCLDDLDVDITDKTPEEVAEINKIINNYINSQTTKEERKSFKVFWNIFIPIIVGVIVAAICVAFGLK